MDNNPNEGGESVIQEEVSGNDCTAAPAKFKAKLHPAAMGV